MMSTTNDTEVVRSILEGRAVYREAWAAQQKVANSGQKALLLVIAIHADSKTLACWLSTELLMFESSISSKTTLHKNVNGLAKDGFIATIPLLRARGRGQTSTLYVLNVDGWLDDAETIEEVERRAEARSEAMSGEAAGDFVPRKFKLGDVSCSGLRLPATRSR